MELTYEHQILIIISLTTIPLLVFVLLMWKGIVPPTFAAIGGSILIFTKDIFKRTLVEQYGFSENTVIQATYINIVIMVGFLYYTYKFIKRREQGRDKEDNRQ